MKYILLFFFAVTIQAQNFEKGYLLGDEITSLPSLSELPASNSISDILIVGDTIWLGTSRWLSRSTDNGNSWMNFYGSSAFGTESITSIGYYNGIIFAATAHSVKKDNTYLPEGSGIRFSSDGGETWYIVPQPLDDPSDSSEVYGINVLRALPVTVAVQNLIYDMAFTPDEIWVATFAGGLRKNSISALQNNPNIKWKRVPLPPDRLNSIKPTDTLNFSIQPVGGRFGPESNLNHRLFSVIAINDSTLFAGSANGINKSTDYGVSWVKYNHQNQDEPISGNFIVALYFHKGVSNSPYSNSLWAASWKAEDPNESYGVSYSTDFGQTWKVTLLDEKAHNFSAYSNPSGNNFMIVCPTDNGPYLSTNMSDRWFLPGSIIDNQTKLELQTSVFYSAAYNKDATSLWLGTNDGLVKNMTPSFTWVSSWKLYFASQQLESKNSTYAYPNPFSPRQENVKIKYATNGQTEVTIRIYDFGMNYIRTVIQNVQRGFPIHQTNNTGPDGVNGVIDFWDGKDDSGSIVPNGVYFYRVDFGNTEPVYGKIMVLQ